MRLADLTPESVADDAQRAIETHLHTLAMAAGLTVTSGDLPSDIRHACRVLTIYAQTGQPPGDAPVAEYYISLIPLYSSPSEQDSPTPMPGAEGADPQTPWGVVLRACLVRDQIDDKNDVTAADLAVLASLSPQAVRQLIAAGEIRTRKHRDDSRPGKAASVITAAEARRWLSGRGVLGFA